MGGLKPLNFDGYFRPIQDINRRRREIEDAGAQHLARSTPREHFMKSGATAYHGPAHMKGLWCAVRCTQAEEGTGYT